MEFLKENCRFYVLTELQRGETAKEAHETLNHAWDDNAPAYYTVKSWWKECRDGARTSVCDGVQWGRPVSSRVDAAVTKVCQFIESDPRLSVRDLSELSRVPSTTV